MKSESPFFGTTSDPERAFPDIKSLTVRVSQDPYGQYCKYSSQKEQTYSKNNVPKRTTCFNPRCQQGGIDLQALINFCGSGEYKYSCNGHEGSPQGRRKGDPCDNIFAINVTVERT